MGGPHPHNKPVEGTDADATDDYMPEDLQAFREA